MADASPAEVARRRGRRVGIALFATIVSTMTGIWTVQIIRQVWFPEPVEARVDCREGLRALIASVARARAAAAAEAGGERQAMARFRAELDPAWRLRDAIGRACEPDRQAMRALGDIDRLRYAEEHAVRYGAVDLAQRRRRVQELERTLLGPPPTADKAPRR